jgi:hypothetical protein
MKILYAAMFLAAALFYASSVKAQTTPSNALRLSIGLEAADPTGNARLGSNFVLGGTARLQYRISNSLAITLTSGAYHFFPIEIPGTHTKYQSYGVIPIKAGIEDFFVPNIYFGAEAGVGIEQTDNGVDPARLLLSPTLGYVYQHWDIGIHYDNFSSTGDHYGLIGLRVAYGFRLRKCACQVI